MSRYPWYVKSIWIIRYEKVMATFRSDQVLTTRIEQYGALGDRYGVTSPLMVAYASFGAGCTLS